MRMLTAIAIALGIYSCQPFAQGVASQAAIWSQKDSGARMAYLEGMCEGLQAAQLPVANLSCYDVLTEQPNGRQLFRFCGAVNSYGGRKAMAYLDEFYRDQRHSDVPVWAAAVAFNDNACRERNAGGQLQSLQARGECMRKLTALLELKVDRTVVEAQSKKCKELQ
jgi:hypothetical protein